MGMTGPGSESGIEKRIGEYGGNEKEGEDGSSWKSFPWGQEETDGG